MVRVAIYKNEMNSKQKVNLKKKVGDVKTCEPQTHRKLPTM